MARKAEEIKTFSELWDIHVSLYKEIFKLALGELSRKECPLDHENKISWMLYPILKRICATTAKDENKEIPTPLHELPIPPLTEHELEEGSFGKRPDFTCNRIDLASESPEDYEIPLHIECKRLGDSSSPSWNLNKNYVENGVKRFDSSEHQYGKRSNSGMMVGYIINMNPSDILTEIGKHLQAFSSISTLSFTFATAVAECEQPIQRKSIDPSSFKIIHLWVDLRAASAPMVASTR